MQSDRRIWRGANKRVVISARDIGSFLYRHKCTPPLLRTPRTAPPLPITHKGEDLFVIRREIESSVSMLIRSPPFGSSAAHASHMCKLHSWRVAPAGAFPSHAVSPPPWPSPPLDRPHFDNLSRTPTSESFPGDRATVGGFRDCALGDCVPVRGRLFFASLASSARFSRLCVATALWKSARKLFIMEKNSSG